MAHVNYLIKRLGIRIANKFIKIFLVSLVVTMVIAAIFFRKQLLGLLKSYLFKLKQRKVRPKAAKEKVPEVPIIQLEYPAEEKKRKTIADYYKKSINAVKLFFYNLLVKKLFAKIYKKEVKLTQKDAMVQIKQLKELIKKQHQIYEARQRAKEQKRKKAFEIFDEKEGKKKEEKEVKKEEIKKDEQVKKSVGRAKPQAIKKQPKPEKESKTDVFDKLKKLSKIIKKEGRK